MSGRGDAAPGRDPSGRSQTSAKEPPRPKRRKLPLPPMRYSQELLVCLTCACMIVGSLLQTAYVRYFVIDYRHYSVPGPGCTIYMGGWKKKVFDFVPVAVYLVLGLFFLVLACFSHKKEVIVPPPPREERERQIRELLGKGRKELPVHECLARLQEKEVKAKFQDHSIEEGLADHMVKLSASGGKDVDVGELAGLLSHARAETGEGHEPLVGASLKLMIEKFEVFLEAFQEEQGHHMQELALKVDDIIEAEAMSQEAAKAAKAELSKNLTSHRELLAREVQGTLCCPGRRKSN